MLQAPSGSPSISEDGQADQHAAEAEADMTEAGDVGEWLGMDSSRAVVANAASANGLDAAASNQQHGLSRETSSTHMDRVRPCSVQTCMTVAWACCQVLVSGTICASC